MPARDRAPEENQPMRIPTNLSPHTKRPPDAFTGRRLIS